jgi:hypothetical protein
MTMDVVERVAEVVGKVTGGGEGVGGGLYLDGAVAAGGPGRTS